MALRPVSGDTVIGRDDIEIGLVGWVRDVLSTVPNLTVYRGGFPGPVPSAPRVRVSLLSDSGEDQPSIESAVVSGQYLDRVTQRRTATASILITTDARARELAETLEAAIVGPESDNLSTASSIAILEVVGSSDVTRRAPGTQALERAVSLDLRVGYRRTTSGRVSVRATSAEIDTTVADGDSTRTFTITAN